MATMKRLIMAMACVGLVAGAALYFGQPKTTPLPPAEPIAEPTPGRVVEDTVSPRTLPGEPAQPPLPETAVDSGQRPPASLLLNEVKPETPTNSTVLLQAIDILVSPQTGFPEKQAAWKRLRDAGELDQALETLKQGATNNPASPEYPTALGEAYVYKLQTMQDFHDIAILALQADQSFNAALALDPANWEAQFFKASSLSHWPAAMNKGPEVIQQLSSLIDQQEAMPTQPQFAQTYVLLGDQYRKANQADAAVQTWRLGLARFPGDPTLQARIGSP